MRNIFRRRAVVIFQTGTCKSECIRVYNNNVERIAQKCDDNIIRNRTQIGTHHTHTSRYLSCFLWLKVTCRRYLKIYIFNVYNPRACGTRTYAAEDQDPERSHVWDYYYYYVERSALPSPPLEFLSKYDWACWVRNEIRFWDARRELENEFVSMSTQCLNTMDINVNTSETYGKQIFACNHFEHYAARTTQNQIFLFFVGSTTLFVSDRYSIFYSNNNKLLNIVQ